MAEAKNGKCGYIGSIPNAGTASVKAPHQISQPAKDKVSQGKDLRSGSK